MTINTKRDDTVKTSVYSDHEHPLGDNMHTTLVKMEDKVNSVTFGVYEIVEEHVNRRRYYHDSGATRPIGDITNREDATYTFRVEINIALQDELGTPVNSWVPLPQYDRKIALGELFNVTVKGVPAQGWVRARIVRSEGSDTIRKVRILTRT